MLPNITATGRLGSDPELTFTPQGKALAKFRIACGERIKKNDQWEDGDTTWLSVALWEKDAEAAAEHLKKGDEVTVVGLLLVRDFEAKDGSKGRSVEVKYGKVSKSLPREKSAPSNGGGWQQQAPVSNASADPWSTGPAASSTSNDEPPF